MENIGTYFKTKFLSSQKLSLRIVKHIKKGIEYLFGNLKQHFTMLKSGIRVHKIELARMIFKTACTLDNVLLELDRINSISCNYGDQ